MKRCLAAVVIMGLLLVALPVGAAEDASSSENVRSLGTAKASTWIHRATFKDNLLFAAYASDVSSGFDVYRIGADREQALTRLSRFPCPGNSEGTISHWKNFVFQALEAPPPDKGGYNSKCGPERGGIRVVDVSDPRNPRKVGFISLTCGSHGITTFPRGDRLFIYNTNGCSGQGELSGSTGQGGILNTVRKIDVIEFDPNRPSKPKSHGKPEIEGMAGCHDVTIYAPRELAVCTGTGRWALLDLSDPFNPESIGLPIDDLATGAGSAQFTWDGQYVLMNEIPGRGFLSHFGCFGAHRESAYRMRIWNIEDTSNPVLAGMYTLKREPPMWRGPSDDYRCHPANFTVVPMNNPGRYVAVTAWGAGGMSSIDFSDPGNIKEIAHWQPDRPHTMWWSAWYNGRVYVSENWGLETHTDGVTALMQPRDWPANIRVLDIEGLGPRETRFFKKGLVTQWQDPADLRR